MIRAARPTSIPLPDSPAAREQRRLLNKFLAQCSDLRELETRLGRFGLFRVLKFEEGEIRHSNVLAWLFDPFETHALDDAFLKRFLVLLKARYPDDETLPDVIDIEAARFQGISVNREWANRETRDRLDLLIELDAEDDEKWIIAIEVKVGARQAEGQLLRYAEKVKGEWEGKAHVMAFVFLTKDSEQPEDGSGFCGVDFGLVYEALMDCSQRFAGDLAPGPKLLIEEYQRLLEAQFMPNSDIEKLARKIYREHRDALDIIFRYRQDFITSVSGKVPGGNLMPDVRIIKRNKGNVHLLPDAWNTPANRNGKHFHLYLLVDFYYGPASLRIVLEGGDKAFRKRFFDAARAGGFTGGDSKGEKWSALHTEKLDLEITEDAFESDEQAAVKLLDEATAAVQEEATQRRIAHLSSVLDELDNISARERGAASAQ